MLKRCATFTIGAFLLFAPRPSAAQGPWAVELGGERSHVTNSGVEATWDTVHAQVAFVRPTLGGWFASVERQRRNTLDDVIGAVSGYRRLGDWTIGGGVAAAPHPSFVYRASIDGQVSRRIFGTTVASIGYRHYAFPAHTVEQLQPAITWNYARGEVEGRLYLTSKESGRSVTGAIHAIFDATPRLRLVVAAARGDRIFDVAALSTRNATATTLNARLRVGVTARDFIEIGGGGAHENPVFDQRTISVVYRRAF